MRASLDARQEQFTLQAHFASPVFDLLQDLPSLIQHLFRTLGSYGLRLGDVRLDSAGESLGEVNLQLSWPNLAMARLFLDRVELTSASLPFLSYRDGALIADLLGSAASYSTEISYRAFTLSHEIHGKMEAPLKDFLSRFSAAAPRALEPSLGSGTIFYFGAAGNRLAGSLALDISRLVEEGLFLKLVIIYDGQQVDPPGLLTAFRSDFSGLIDEIGLDLAGD